MFQTFIIKIERQLTNKMFGCLSILFLALVVGYLLKLLLNDESWEWVPYAKIHPTIFFWVSTPTKSNPRRIKKTGNGKKMVMLVSCILMWVNFSLVLAKPCHNIKNLNILWFCFLELIFINVFSYRNWRLVL